MNAVEFMRAVLPSSGIKVIATFPHKSKQTGLPIFWHHPFGDVEKAAKYALSQRDNFDVYFWTHTTEARAQADGTFHKIKRSADRAWLVRSLYVDLDVGRGAAKYATLSEAAADLIKFCKTTGLSKPMVVCSGRGFHVYWTFTHDVPSTEWKPAAEKLKRLLAYHGLKADPTVTADAARVLRVACTYNRKDADNPLKVVVETSGAPPAPFSDIVAIIDRASVDLPSSGHLADAGALVGEATASTVPETPENVEKVRAMLAAIPPDIERGVWMKAVWGVAALTWNCGEELARSWSASGEKFDEGEFGKVWSSFDPTRSGGIGVGTLVRLAAKSGYARSGLTGQSGVENLGSGTRGIGLASVFDGASSPDATGDIVNADRLACGFQGSWLWIEDEGAWVRFSPATGWLKVAETEALTRPIHRTV